MPSALAWLPAQWSNQAYADRALLADDYHRYRPRTASKCTPERYTVCHYSESPRVGQIAPDLGLILRTALRTPRPGANLPSACPWLLSEAAAAAAGRVAGQARGDAVVLVAHVGDDVDRGTAPERGGQVGGH